MGDPLFSQGFDWGVLALVVLKALLGFAFVLVGVIFMIWFERKLIADFQNRIGPNRAGPWGLLQTLADGIKLIFKEDLRPDSADPFVFRLAPYLSVVPAFLTFTIVPIGGIFKGGHDGSVHVFGHDTFLQVANPPIGVLFLLAMSSVGVYGAMLAGWASGSKYPLLGSVRASASMISYEAALGLSVVTVILLSGSLTTHDIVAVQAGGQIVPDWNIVATAFLPFVIFCIAATAELNRPPFDFAEAEQELVAGFHTEYSSMRFGMFYLAEFMNTITMSAIIVTLFLGGPAGPIGPGPEQLWPIFWFMLKLLVFLGAFVWVRGTVPRYRYDQLMDLGWKRLIPLALLWLLFIASIRIGRDQDWNVFVVPTVAVITVLLVFGLLAGSLRTAAERRDEHDEELGEVVA
jgi:NADH-quinone oxidoreductase subunit H